MREGTQVVDALQRGGRQRCRMALLARIPDGGQRNGRHGRSRPPAPAAGRAGRPGRTGASTARCGAAPPTTAVMTAPAGRAEAEHERVDVAEVAGPQVVHVDRLAAQPFHQQQQFGQVQRAQIAAPRTAASGRSARSAVEILGLIQDPGAQGRRISCSERIGRLLRENACRDQELGALRRDAAPVLALRRAPTRPSPPTPHGSARPSIGVDVRVVVLAPARDAGTARGSCGRRPPRRHPSPARRRSTAPRPAVGRRPGGASLRGGGCC